MASVNIPVFAYKGETTEDYWSFIARTFIWGKSQDGKFIGPTMILDDGGDATLFFTLGLLREQGRISEFDAILPKVEDGQIIVSLLEEIMTVDSSFFRRTLTTFRGVSEETTTGVHRLHTLADSSRLKFPAIDVNNAVTKSKFDNKYGCRQSLIDGLNRATDRMIAGKTAVVCGYGDVGKGCAQALAGQGAKVIISEIDPICALQAKMEGFDVLPLSKVVSQADIVITATGCADVVTLEHMYRAKDMAIFANIGHFCDEIRVDRLKASEAECHNIKPQVDLWVFPDGHKLLLLAEGRLMNLGCATGHPAFVMSNSFSNQVLAQHMLFTQELENKVYNIPKKDDETVAKIHLEALGGETEILTQNQADYLGVPIEGPFKDNNYRY